MNFPKASVTDLIRKNQKDEQFLERYNNSLIEFLRLCFHINEGKIRNISKYLSQLSYYGLTTLSKLQTLGEEYTGIIRFQESRLDLPSKIIQIIWVTLQVFGRDIFLRSIEILRKKISEAETLREDRKESFIKCLTFLREKSPTLSRLHLALFYIEAKYYEISSRLTQITFVSWARNEDFSRPFKLLGLVSTSYLILTLLFDFYTETAKVSYEKNFSNDFGLASRECFLCSDTKMYATLLSCGHFFCWNCAFNVSINQRKCPICRESVDPKNLILLENF